QENPWLARGRRMSARANAAVDDAATSTGAAILGSKQAVPRKSGAAKSGQKLPQITPVPVGSSRSNGSKQWDEMLDTEGIDFSQDLEFGDGATVRISPVPLSPQPKEPPLATAAPRQQPQQPDTAAVAAAVAADPKPEPVKSSERNIKSKPNASKPAQIAGEAAETNSPAWPTANNADKQQQQQEQQQKQQQKQQQQSIDRKVEVKVWGKPAKTAAPAKTDNAEDASPNTRWWKASLSGGARAAPQPAATTAATSDHASRRQQQQQQQQKLQPVAAGAPKQLRQMQKRSDRGEPRASQADRSERSGRLQRGGRRHQVPVPTVVPPLLLTRAGMRSTMHIDADIDDSAADTASIEEPVPKVKLPEASETEEAATKSGGNGGQVVPASNFTSNKTVHEPGVESTIALAPAHGTSKQESLESKEQPAVSQRTNDVKSNGVPRPTTAAQRRPEPGQSWRKDGRENRSMGNWRSGHAQKDTANSQQVYQPKHAAANQLVSSVPTPVMASSKGVARDDSKPQQHNSFERGKHEPMSKAKMASSWRSIPNKESLQNTASSASAALAPLSAMPAAKSAAGQHHYSQAADAAAAYTVPAASAHPTQGGGGGGRSEYHMPDRRQTISTIPAQSGIASERSTGLTPPPQPLLPHTMLADILGDGDQSACISSTPRSSASVGGSGAVGKIIPVHDSSREAPSLSKSQHQQLRSESDMSTSNPSYVPHIHSSASLFNLGNNSSPLFTPYGATRPGFFSADQGNSPTPRHAWTQQHSHAAQTTPETATASAQSPGDVDGAAQAHQGPPPASVGQPTGFAGGSMAEHQQQYQQQPWNYHPAQVAPMPGYMGYGGFSVGADLTAVGPMFSPFSASAASLWAADASQQNYEHSVHQTRNHSGSRSSSHGDGFGGSRAYPNRGSGGSGSRGSGNRAPRPIGTRSGNNTSTSGSNMSGGGHGHHGGGHQPHHYWQPHYAAVQQQPQLPPPHGYGSRSNSRLYPSPHDSPRMFAVPSPVPAMPAYMPSVVSQADGSMVAYPQVSQDLAADGNAGLSPYPGIMASPYMAGAVRPSPPPPPPGTYGYGAYTGTVHIQQQQQQPHSYMPFPPHPQATSVTAAHMPYMQPMYMGPPPVNAGVVYSVGSPNVGPYFYGQPVVQELQSAVTDVQNPGVDSSNAELQESAGVVAADAGRTSESADPQALERSSQQASPPQQQHHHHHHDAAQGKNHPGRSSGRHRHRGRKHNKGAASSTGDKPAAKSPPQDVPHAHSRAKTDGPTKRGGRRSGKHSAKKQASATAA
ncbi:hypothetical protein EC988_003137, partial [Linderina pennispora]